MVLQASGGGNMARVASAIISCALVFSGIIPLVSGETTTAQQPTTLDGRKAQLEIQKLELEVKRLTEDRHELPALLTAFLGLLLGVAGTAATIWVARLARRGALDQSVHEKRLELYPGLVKAAADLALYFPRAKAVGPEECRAMGESMRVWYFKGGGLLMSTDARNGYFTLARALTRASLAERLSVPVFPKDADSISEQSITDYRDELKEPHLDDVENWTFGGSESESENPALRFKDFVFLQHLSSTLRTKLCKDLHSRRRPA
jgi:hypothetical protein